MELDRRPSHLVGAVGDRRTLCGIDTRTKAGKPYLLARHLPAHRAGHARVGKVKLVCEDCERAATESGST